VIVNLRLNSPLFGKWSWVELSRPESQLWLPSSIAHGFYRSSRISEFVYKVANYYDPSSERGLNWNESNF
jgi:dTDP-4-dehydrorhamnose 3,5-epimerase